MIFQIWLLLVCILLIFGQKVFCNWLISVFICQIAKVNGNITLKWTNIIKWFWNQVLKELWNYFYDKSFDSSRFLFVFDRNDHITNTLELQKLWNTNFRLKCARFFPMHICTWMFIVPLPLCSKICKLRFAFIRFRDVFDYTIFLIRIYLKK